MGAQPRTVRRTARSGAVAPKKAPRTTCRSERFPHLLQIHCSRRMNMEHNNYSFNPMITYHCLRCGEELSRGPEKDCGDWFLPCLSCGARNILAPLFGLVGWILA